MVATAPADTQAAPFSLTPEPSRITTDARAALQDAEATVRHLQARKAEIPGHYAAAVQRADGSAMRTLARTSLDLEEDILAARITAARCAVAVARAERDDAQTLLAPGNERVVTAQAALDAARADLALAEQELRSALIVNQAAVSHAQSHTNTVAAAQQRLDVLIKETLARVQ